MKDSFKSDESAAPAIARTAKVKAVQDNALILEVSDTGEHITWPLSALPQPFALDGEVTLELKGIPAENSTRDLSITQKTHQLTQKNSALQESADEDTHRRKLLEQLIN